METDKARGSVHVETNKHMQTEHLRGSEVGWISCIGVELH